MCFFLVVSSQNEFSAWKPQPQQCCLSHILCACWSEYHQSLHHCTPNTVFCPEMLVWLPDSTDLISCHPRSCSTVLSFQTRLLFRAELGLGAKLALRRLSATQIARCESKSSFLSHPSPLLKTPYSWRHPRWPAASRGLITLQLCKYPELSHLCSSASIFGLSHSADILLYNLFGRPHNKRFRHRGRYLDEEEKWCVLLLLSFSGSQIFLS